MVCFGLETGKVVFSAMSRTAIKRNSTPKVDRGDPDDVKCHELRRELDDAMMKRLAHGSYRIFEEARAIPARFDKNRRLAVVSQKYRSLIHTVFYNEREEVNEEICTTLLTADFIWHLAEILFINNESGSGNLTLLQDLIGWVTMRFSESAELATSLLGVKESGADENVDEQPRYWDAVYMTFLHLQLELTKQLLAENLHSDQEPFALALGYIRRAQELLGDETCRMSPHEYVMKRKTLAADCQMALATGQFNLIPQLKFIPRLFACEVDTMNSLIVDMEIAVKWYQLLPAAVFFSSLERPSTKTVTEAAQTCVHLGRHFDEPIAPEDAALFALSQMDMRQAIEACTTGLKSQWFLAHFVDLMFRTGVLDSLPEGEGRTLRNYHLVEYGAQLMNHVRGQGTGLWCLALHYLDECRDTLAGLGHLEARLACVAPKSDFLALLVINAARKRSLDEVANSVCRAKTTQALARRSFYDACKWAMRSKDPDSIARAGSELLRSIVEDGSRECLEGVKFLDIPAAWCAASPDLAFLARYREFYVYMAAMDFPKALKLLVDMTKAKSVPDCFLGILQQDAVNLVKNASADITVFDLMFLMNFVRKKPVVFGSFHVAAAMVKSVGELCEPIEYNRAANTEGVADSVG